MSIGQGNITYTGASAGSGSGPLPGVTVPLIKFRIGDGQAGTPIAGSTSLRASTIQGQNIVNKQLLVSREGILLQYSSPGTTMQITRYNSLTQGGFDFEPSSGLTFVDGEDYNIYITGINNTIEP